VKKPQFILSFICYLTIFYFFGKSSFAQNQQIVEFFGYPFFGNPTQSCEFGILGDCFYPDQYHLAEDYDMEVGESVLACADGIVMESQWHNGYGGTVLIEHQLPFGDERVVSLYAHLQVETLEVEEDDFVVRGQPLGYIANTGDNGGNYSPHLHLGIHKGQYLNSTTCDGEWTYHGYSTDTCDLSNWLDPSDFIKIGHFENMSSNMTLKFIERYETKMGVPFEDDKGNIYVHKWPENDSENYVFIQNFKNYYLTSEHYGTDGETALIYNPSQNKCWLVKEGFWGAYKPDLFTLSDAYDKAWAFFGPRDLGTPMMDEDDLSGSNITYQEFEKGLFYFYQGDNILRVKFKDGYASENFQSDIEYFCIQWPDQTAHDDLGQGTLISQTLVSNISDNSGGTNQPSSNVYSYSNKAQLQAITLVNFSWDIQDVPNNSTTSLYYTTDDINFESIASIDATQTSFNWTPPFDQETEYRIKVVVSDSAGMVVEIQISDQFTYQPVDTPTPIPSVSLPLHGSTGETILGVGQINASAYSTNGFFIATGGSLGAFLWDTNTGEIVRWLPTDHHEVLSIAFSPDNGNVLIGGSDGLLQLWSIESGQEIRDFSGFEQDILSVSLSPDGSKIAAGGKENVVKLWHIDSSQEYLTLNDFGNWINSLAFSPNSTKLLTGSSDNSVKVWSVASGTLLNNFDAEGRANSVTFSPDGTKVLAARSNTNFDGVWMWDINTSEFVQSFSTSGNSNFQSVAFSPDGSMVLVGRINVTFSEYEAILYETSSGNKLRTFYGHLGSIEAVAFSPDSSMIFTGSLDGTTKLWNIDTGQEIRTIGKHLGLNTRILSITFSPDGEYMLTGNGDHLARLWQVSNGEVVQTYEGHESWVSSAIFSSDGSMILTSSHDDTIRLWDKNTAQELQTYTGQRRAEFAVFSPNTSRVLAGGASNSTTLWDTNSGARLHTLIGHQNTVLTGEFTLDGSRIYTGSSDGTVKLWSAATGEEILTLYSGNKDHSVYSIVLSPDGTQVVIGLGDGTVKKLDAETGNELGEFLGHSQEVQSVAYSPNGTMILTGSEDGTAKIWNAETYQDIREFSSQIGQIESVAFSPDGTKVAIGGWDGVARIWDISNESSTMLIDWMNY
jgi:WD40 repeat protein